MFIAQKNERAKEIDPGQMTLKAELAQASRLC